MKHTPPANPEPPIDRALRRAARELAWDAGEGMAFFVAARLHRSLLETAAGAEAAGLAKESAVACFIRLSREVCEELCHNGAERGELN